MRFQGSWASFPQRCYTRCFLFSILASLLPVFFFFLSMGAGGVSIPLVYMFLDSKALFVVSFLFHMIWNGLLPGFTGVAGKKCPDEVMQSGEMCRSGFCDIRWKMKASPCGWRGLDRALFLCDGGELGFLACIQRERVNTTTN